MERAASERSAGRSLRSLRDLVVACSVVVAVSGCVSRHVVDETNRRLEFGMSTSELKIAYGATFHEARTEGARVTAGATVSDNAASASPGPSRTCTSGRLLHITMAGQFPHKPFLGQAGSARVSGQQLTVDATTGRLCDAHYVTGSILTDPSSVLLFSR